ncbi:MAG: indole-3-glycerol-phosphate synthase [Thermosulfidibacteraceae bacterium]|jgi:indole-3-glycerol phosphate synthase
MDFLKKVREIKEREVEAIGRITRNRPFPLLSFKSSLIEAPIIAEIKQASPSKGLIIRVDPVTQARKYVEGGAGAISILVDSNFFGGSWEYISIVKEKFNIPILCKEFIISERQIVKAYNYGADAILLISKLLSSLELVDLYNFAIDLGLEVLVEIHSEDELERISSLNPFIVGVNSRDLKILHVDKKHAKRVISLIRDKYFVVAESGIESEEDIKEFTLAGARAFLIGEVLMKSGNPTLIIERFTSVYKDLRNKGS